MKRTFFTFIALFMIFTLLSPIRVSAKGIDSSNSEHALKSTTTYQNEYQGINEKIKELKSEPATLNMDKFKQSQEELTYYENLKTEYHKHIYQLKSLSSEELIKLHYSAAQIEAIQNYDGSELMTVAASAIFVGTLSLTFYYYSAADYKTYARSTFSGHWEGKPDHKFVDMAAIAMYGSSASFSKVSASGTATYWTSTADVFDVTLSGTYQAMRGMKYNVPFNSYSTVYGEVGTFYSVYCQYYAVATGNVNVMEYGGAYGHTSINITPTINISISPLSFTPGIYTVIIFDDTLGATI